LKRNLGFTMLELMIVVAIIGTLASIAIPVFGKMVKRSKSTEALMNLRRMFDGALTSYQGDEVDRGGGIGIPKFPDTVVETPGENACCDGAKFRCPPNSRIWKKQTWQELQFSIDDPHFYWYEFVSEGEGLHAQFTARALGNLDCNDRYSTFERIGFVDLSMGVSGSAGVFKKDPLE